nr:hypothetical protein CFP56_46701 [Quercus suber]
MLSVVAARSLPRSFARHKGSKELICAMSNNEIGRLSAKVYDPKAVPSIISRVDPSQTLARAGMSIMEQHVDNMS